MDSRVVRRDTSASCEIIELDGRVRGVTVTSGGTPQSVPAPHVSTGRLRASRAALLQALDMVPHPVFFVNERLSMLTANASASETLGHTPGELREMMLSDLIEAGELLAPAVERLLNDETADELLPTRLRNKLGMTHAIQLQMQLADATLGPLIVVIAHPGTTEAGDAGIARSDSRDFLTSLPTRQALEHRLRRTERRARRLRGRFAVLFVDLDGFKSINDTQGHHTGDLVLVAIAERLLKCVRPGDFVARYGGDEFVAIVEDVGTDEEVTRIADRIRAELCTPVSVGEDILQVTASVGVAIGQTRASARAIIDAADRDMYRAKRARNEAGGRG